MATETNDLNLEQARAYALDDDALSQLVSSFERSLADSLESLRTLMQTPDPETLLRTLHDLKGFIGLLSGASLRQLVADIEQHSRQQPLAATLQRLGPLCNRLQALLAAVRARQDRYH